jgi:CHAT domain-containing protein
MQLAESYGIFEDYMKNDVLEILTVAAKYTGLYDLGLGHAFERIRYSQSKSDYLSLSHAYNSIALIYKRLLDKRKALEYFKKSIALREKYAPAWTPYVTINVGEMYMETGQIDSASIWFRRTLDLLGNQDVTENLLYSVLYSSLAVVAGKKGDYAQSVYYIDKCIAIRSRYFDQDDLHFTDFLKLKSELLLQSGDPEAAHDILENLRTGYTEADRSPQIISGYYQTMAKYFEAVQRIPEAINAHQESIIALSRDFTDTDPFQLPEREDYFYGKEKLLKVIIQKASLLNSRYHETGDLGLLNSVKDHYNFALVLINLIIDDQSSMLSVSDLFKDFKKLYETAISTTVSLNEWVPGEEVYSEISSFMEASRMNHYKILSRLNRVIALGGIPDSIISRKQELERILTSQGPGAGEKPGKDHEHLRMELDRLQYLVNHDKNGENRIRSDEFDLLGKCQKYLNKNQIILQYYFGEEKLYILATTKRSGFFCTMPWGAQEEADLNVFIKGLKQPVYDSELNALGRRVYHSLGLDSVLREGIDEVIVIPDQALYFVPFDALIDDSDNFLISKYTIYTENSLYMMNAREIRFRKNKSALAYAPFAVSEITTEAREASNRSDGTRLLQLPGSGTEIRTIFKLFGGIVKTGSMATEEYFKNNARDFRIIHFSSHSNINDEDPFFNSIILAPGEGIEDGHLQTNEIYNLDLNTELVTLSACNTGAGNYLDGEGMISLATGFRTAGVRNIVMSLWSLPDDATSDVMRRFYRLLKEGQDKGDALRMAKLAYLEHADRNTSAPYFWAATVLAGKNTPLAFKSINLFYATVGAGICMLLAGMFFIRKRQKTRPDEQ